MADLNEDLSNKIKNLRGTKVGTSNTDTYPLYPVEDDIYNQSKQEENIDPENLSKNKTPNGTDLSNERNFQDDITGGDLDIPGSELDDAEELIGEEDEENNIYSMGGDRLNDLEEDHGE